MRVPRFQFSIRLMMVAVFVAAASFWCLDLRRKSIAYQNLADTYKVIPIHVDSGPTLSSPEEVAEHERYVQAYNAAWEAYCSRMQTKYERAARYPWLPVEPDPPKPK